MLFFLVGALLGAIIGGAICVRYLRREIADEIGPKHKRVQLQLDNLEDRLDDKEFAFPKERKEPLTDARHVRNAIARFDQVEGVSDAERNQAWKRILAAAKRYDVEVSASDWRDLFKGGQAGKR
jgi:predicted acylesterase/phospholipase RssA